MNIPLLFEYRPGWDYVALGGTFTRATTATYVDRNGIVRTAASGALRDAHYIGGVRTVLVEPQRTNIALRSQEFDNASWTKTRSSVSANADVAPDGTTTADRLIEDATATNTHLVNQSVTITANANVAISVYAKAGTRSFIVLRLIDSTNTDRFDAIFDLSAGSMVSSSTSGTGAVLLTRIEALPNGWYRCIISGNIGNGRTACNTQVFLSSGNSLGAATYTGDGVSYVSFWGGQTEDAAGFASSYIPTTTASVTRNADILAFSFSPAPQAVTLYGDGYAVGAAHQAASSFGITTMAQIGSGATARFVGVRLNAGDVNRRVQVLQRDTGTATQVVSDAPSGTVVYGTRVEGTLQLASSGAVSANQALDGGSTTSGSASSAFALSPAWDAAVVQVGQSNGSVGGWAIRCIRIASSAQTLATMRTPASYIVFTDSSGTAYLSNEKPFPGDRFANWTPDSDPYGESAPRLSDGAITMMRFRDDYAVSFDLPAIPARDASNPSALDLADRLQYHLKNGGTCFVATGDALGSGYGPLGLKPGTKPQLALSDRRTVEYTLSLQLQNLATTPVRLSAYYAEQ